MQNVVGQVGGKEAKISAVNSACIYTKTHITDT
jgi:hypothetical protein